MSNRHQRGSALRTRRLTTLLTLAALGVALAACGSSNESPPASPTIGSSSSTTTPATRASNTKTATDRDRGTTITVQVGDRLRVTLASTYWVYQPSSDPAVLRSDGPPVISTQHERCVPGAGCGTATAVFTATAIGTATITATRTSCGEALACTGNAGHYQVHIVVK